MNFEVENSMTSKYDGFTSFYTLPIPCCLLITSAKLAILNTFEYESSADNSLQFFNLSRDMSWYSNDLGTNSLIRF